MNAAVGFMHDGQAYTIDKGVTPSVKASTVQFPAQKFSTYGVYGKTKSATPGGKYGGLSQTGDSKQMLMLLFGGIVLIASFVAVFAGKKQTVKKGPSAK